MIVELFYVSPYVLTIDTFFAHSLCLRIEQNAGAGDSLIKHRRKWFNTRCEYGTYLRTSFFANRRRTHCVTEGAKKEVQFFIQSEEPENFLVIVS